MFKGVRCLEKNAQQFADAAICDSPSVPSFASQKNKIADFLIGILAVLYEAFSSGTEGVGAEVKRRYNLRHI